jgi:protein-disulfide isomerase
LEPELVLDPLDEVIDLDRPSPAALPTADDHLRGDPAAPVVLLEYGEFECPDCGRTYHVAKRLLEDMPGQVAIAFRHFARDDVHPFSERSALAAEAAGAQGRFWEMHDFLFEHQHELEIVDLVRHAAELGLDVDAFQRDLLDRVHLEKVAADLRAGQEAGVTQTPTIFINGVEHTGSYDYETLRRAIRSQTP